MIHIAANCSGPYFLRRETGSAWFTRTLVVGWTFPLVYKVMKLSMAHNSAEVSSDVRVSLLGEQELCGAYRLCCRRSRPVGFGVSGLPV